MGRAKEALLSVAVAASLLTGIASAKQGNPPCDRGNAGDNARQCRGDDTSAANRGSGDSRDDGKHGEQPIVGVTIDVPPAPVQVPQQVTITVPPPPPEPTLPNITIVIPTPPPLPNQITIRIPHV